LIQGLQAAVQLVLWLGVVVIALVGFLSGRRKAAPGAQQNQTLQGDRVLRDKIGEQVNTGGGLYVEGSITVVGAAAADRFLGSLRPRLSKDSLRQATAAYFQALLDRHLYLNMKGMGVADRVPLRLPLLDVYVPLRARLELPEGETWRRDLKLAGRALSGDEAGAPDLRMSDPVPVLELLQKHSGLIILATPARARPRSSNFWRCGWRWVRVLSWGWASVCRCCAVVGYANALSVRDVPWTNSSPSISTTWGPTCR